MKSRAARLGPGWDLSILVTDAFLTRMQNGHGRARI
jgi:hypothetical protein